MPLALGSRIGAYEVVSQLGAGGMGEVYRARDSKLKREVAIKVLPAEVAADRERLARFQREAEVLASLNHPNIAQVHGLENPPEGGHHTGPVALVMELVEGEDLSQRIARGPIPIDEAVPIAKQIAEALEAAHEQGIIHRDLKPANIKLRDDGTVKVLDFGLAKAFQDPKTSGPQDPSHSPTITSPAMTMRGVILGTAAYMSPEQAKGRPVDKRSDLWAFGCVLYEMLSGQRAFEGEDVSDTLASVLKGEPDWSRLPSSTPPLLIEAVRGCLNRDRRQRVADASTIRFALDSTARPSAPLEAAFDAKPLVINAVAAERRRVQRHYLLPLAGLCLALAIASVYVLWFRPQSAIAPPTVSRFILNLPQDYGLPVTGRHALTISDDGQQIAYLAVGSLELRRVSDFDAQRIATAQGLSTPLFSPDGRTLVFHEAFQNVIKRVSTTGGAAVDVCPIAAPFGLSWDNGTLLVGLGRQGIVRCTLSGGSPQPVLSAGNGEELHGPQMLPDGDHLLFTVAKTADGETRWDKSNIVVESLSTHTRTVLIEGASDGRLLSTGHLVFAREGVVFAVPFDASTRRAIGDPTPVIEGVRRTGAGTTGAAQFAVSGSGSLVYLPGPARTMFTNRVLAIATREGVVTRLPVEAGRYVHTRASPDGKQLAVGSDDGRAAVIWIYALGSNAAMRRLVLPGRNEFPIWSPDGKQLAFLSDGHGDRGMFVQSADGTGAVVRLTTAAAHETHIPEAWSPTGQHLVFAVRKGDASLNAAGDYTLRMLDRTTQQVSSIAITSREPIGAVFSPDGRWLAVSQSEGIGGIAASNRGVFVQRFPSGELYQAPRQALDFHVTWSPRGNELIYVTSAAAGRLAVVPVQTSPNVQFGALSLIPATVTGGRVSSMTRAYDVLPDGRFIGIVSAGEAQDIPRLEVRVVLNWLEELKQRVPVAQ